MKILKLFLVLVVVLTFIVMFGCQGLGSVPRKEEVEEVEEVEEKKAEDWWEPKEGTILENDLPEPDKNAGPFTVAHALNDTELSFCVDVWDGFEETAKEYPNMELHQFSCRGNPDDSLKAVLDIQTLNPDLVIYFNWTGAGWEMARWCEENQVPEIEIDVPYGEKAWFYGGSSEMMGILGGEKYSEWVKENWAGEDIWIVQNTEYESGEEIYLRNSEFLRVFLEKVGDSVNVMNLGEEGKVDELNGDTSPELGLQLFTDWLTAHPEAHHIVVWSMTDEACSGMYAAAKNLDRLDNCVFASINGVSSALNIIVKDERYIGTVGIFPELYGQGALKMAMCILTGVEIPKTVIPKHAWITLENLGDYYPKYLE